MQCGPLEGAQDGEGRKEVATRQCIKRNAFAKNCAVVETRLPRSRPSTAACPAASFSQRKDPYSGSRQGNTRVSNSKVSQTGRVWSMNSGLLCV